MTQPEIDALHERAAALCQQAMARTAISAAPVCAMLRSLAAEIPDTPTGHALGVLARQVELEQPVLVGARLARLRFFWHGHSTPDEQAALDLALEDLRR